MPRNNNSKSIHAQRLKAIRPYINFNYDLRKPLSSYQKSKIKKYFDEVDALTARPFHVYRPRKKERLKKAQEFGQHEKQLPGLKVAFIPSNGKDKPKIHFNSAGDIVATTEHITTRVLSLDTFELIKDPVGHVKSVIAKDKKAKRFTVLCGRYEIPVSQSRATIPEFVARLTARYDNEAANNYHGNWLHGLAGHHFNNQADFQEYFNEKQKSKKKMQSERKRAKRRASYAKSKGRR